MAEILGSGHTSLRLGVTPSPLAFRTSEILTHPGDVTFADNGDQVLIGRDGQAGGGFVEPGGTHPRLALTFLFGFALGERPDLPWIGRADV